MAGPGENVRVKLSGIEEEDVLSGFVLSSVVDCFCFGMKEKGGEGRLYIASQNSRWGRKLLGTVGGLVGDLVHQPLFMTTDPKRTKKKPPFVKNGAVVKCRIQVTNLICISNYLDFPQLGRFTLRTEGKT